MEPCELPGTAKVGLAQNRGGEPSPGDYRGELIAAIDCPVQRVPEKNVTMTQKAEFSANATLVAESSARETQFSATAAPSNDHEFVLPTSQQRSTD